jgi:hypothetical protein
MKRCGRWMTLACSILFLVFGRSAEVVAAANCDDVSAGYWHNNQSFAAEMAKARWEQCARRRSGSSTRFESSQAPTATCERFQPYGYFPVPEFECGYGGQRGARYLCRVSGVVCSRN